MFTNKNVLIKAAIIAALSLALLVPAYMIQLVVEEQVGMKWGAPQTLHGFVLVQLQDSALLIGSIGLFFIVAAGMYLTRKMNVQLNQRTVTAEG